MKILVVTSCTGEKRYKPKNQLIQDDFRDPKIQQQKEENLKAYCTTVGEMYTGLQHLRLMEGVRLLRNHFGQQIIDVGVISAGYGYLTEDQVVAPYEVTFNSMNGRDTVEWSRFLRIYQVLNDQVKKYDMVFFLLGDKYLKAIDLPLEGVSSEQKLIFFASNMSRKLIPQMPPYYTIETGKKEAIGYSYGLVGLKGYLFKCMTREVLDHGLKLFDQIYENPMCINQILENYWNQSSN